MHVIDVFDQQACDSCTMCELAGVYTFWERFSYNPMHYLCIPFLNNSAYIHNYNHNYFRQKLNIKHECFQNNQSPVTGCHAHLIVLPAHT